MGNAIAVSCLTSEESFVKVVYWEGNTKTLKGKRWLAGEIMFDYPDSMVCDADCFFIGHPIPFLTIGDHLKPGKTYFVLPLDIFSSKTVSASSVSALIASMPKRAQINFKECPFEYINASNGQVLIKLSTEFMKKILTIRKENHDDQENGSTNGNSSNGSLCSTPELKKHYEQLVQWRISKSISAGADLITIHVFERNTDNLSLQSKKTGGSLAPSGPNRDPPLSWLDPKNNNGHLTSKQS